MNNRFGNINYYIRNQAFHVNDRTVNFYHRLCISLQAYLGERYCITVSLVLISLRHSPKNILGERRSPAFRVPLDYTTGDGRYFQIQKSPYLSNAHVTFKI